MSLLTNADVQLFYGDSTRIVDLTDAHPFSSLTLQGRGTAQPLTPLTGGDVEIVPITLGEHLTASAFWGDRVEAMSAVDQDTAEVVLLLTTTGKGVVIPAGVRDPVSGGLPTEIPNTGVITTSVEWLQREYEPCYYVTDIHPMTADGSIDTSGDTGETYWAVVTTAGSIDGTAEALGVQRVSNVGASATVSGARGFLLATTRQAV